MKYSSEVPKSQLNMQVKASSEVPKDQWSRLLKWSTYGTEKYEVKYLSADQ